VIGFRIVFPFEANQMPFEQIGKYKIVGKIGQGAMGEVYKAHDAVLNRFVAIKTIAGSLGSDDQFRQRFHREAQSAAQLNHKNIVTVFEFAEERGMVYMVMELLEGTDLKELIVRKAIKRLEDKLSIVEQMCDGLAYAHDRGVVHRDLKPANIHVLANGTVKIMDFGLARLGVSEITRTGTVMGTPNYMSPEQVRGEKVDSRSDIFSIGAVMYEVLAGHKAFEAETMHSVLFHVLDQEPAPLRKWIPDMPLPVAQVVEKALTKDPQHRFQGAGEMRAALRNARRVMAAGKAATAALRTPAEGTRLEAEILGEACLARGALDVLVADAPGRQAELWRLRRSVGEAVKKISVYKEEDTVVPRAALAPLVAGVKAIGERHGIRTICYGHAADGNIHVNVLKAGMDDERWNATLPEAIREIFRLTVRLGGMISGEHGIGLTQKPYLSIALSKTALDLTRRLKRAFDPQGLLNPGKILD